MGFMDSYKRLEKLCGDILGDDRGVSAYIEEMRSIPKGTYCVSGWEDDLKQLKHYRWIRNQISHEPDCTEENMCSYADAQWISDFYERILNQADPLARYNSTLQAHCKSTPRKTEKSKPQVQIQNSDRYGATRRSSSSRIKFWSRLLIILDIVAVVILWLLLK